MSKYGLYVVVINIFICSICFGEDRIFDCLRMSDYNCISFEININDHWSVVLDNNKRDVLQVAIDLRSPVLIKYLIGKGARVKKKHVYRTLKEFFAVSKIENQRFPVNKRPILDRLIIAAVNDQDSSCTIAKLSKILGFFASERDIALSIYYLKLSNLLPLRELNLLLKEYYNLFLQDKILDQLSLTDVVRFLLPLNLNKWLILLIIDNYENELRSKNSIEHLIVDHIDTDFMPEKIAYAIMEKSRNIFLGLAPSSYVRKIINKEENHDFDQLIKYSNKLDKFIVLSIEYPTRKIVKNLNYLSWLRVYDFLLKNGDFMGAFIVGTSLNCGKIQKIISDNVYKDLPLLKMDSNFKNYRQTMQLFSTKFYIPAPVVIIRDLNSIGELNILRKTKSGEVINNNGLNYFIKFYSDILIPYKAAAKKKFHTSSAASLLINTLIDDENMKQPTGFEEAYKIMWPHTNSTIFNTVPN